MQEFFAISNIGEYDIGLNFAVVCKPTVLASPDDEATIAFVCGCKTRERAEEIAFMYNYFINMIANEGKDV